VQLETAVQASYSYEIDYTKRMCISEE
jgi:hypothetical protein